MLIVFMVGIVGVDVVVSIPVMPRAASTSRYKLRKSCRCVSGDDSCVVSCKPLTLFVDMSSGWSDGGWSGADG